MKTTTLITVLAAALAVALGSLAPTPAFADRGHRGGGHGYVKPGYGYSHYRGGYGGYYRPRVSVGVVFGPGLWGGYYPYYGYGGYGPYAPSYYGYGPYYYPPAVVAAPAQPQTYIERGAASEAPGSASYWYYCRDANAYYPYVKQCPGGWEQVNPTPPPR